MLQPGEYENITNLLFGGNTKSLTNGIIAEKLYQSLAVNLHCAAAVKTNM